jgi:alpha-ketoglutarate-dependent taurine dioxygenase
MVSSEPVTIGRAPIIEGLDVSAIDLESLSLYEREEYYEFEDFTPHYPGVHWDPLVEYHYTDRALNADNSYRNLFKAATKVRHITPKIGTELEGVNLAVLTDVQKNELALLAANRGVVFFRDQRDLDVHKQLDLGRYYGRLHKHPTTGLPKDPSLDEVHVVWVDKPKAPVQDGHQPNSIPEEAAFKSYYHWHSDVTYEKQPPAYTTLKLLDGPEVGGDTYWASGYALYDLLSPDLQRYLENRTAVHSAVEQANNAKKNNHPVRRDPVVNEHPIVRVHPVTGYKAVFVNPGFTRSIVGVPKAESDAILNYLYSLISSHPAIRVRFQWKKNDVAFWDNRVTFHTPIVDYIPFRRHAIRVTPQGEVPYYDPKGISQQSVVDEAINEHRKAAAAQKAAS